jgi:hypothetical protein
MLGSRDHKGNDMALINCPDCGTEVSDAAPACPKCGRPIALAAQPVHARDRSERSRSPATFTITLSSFVLIVLGIAVAVWFVPALEIGQNLATNCQAGIARLNAGAYIGSSPSLASLTARRWCIM